MEQQQYAIMRAVEDDHFWYRGMRMIVQTLLGLLKKKKFHFILDAGCGTGANMIELQKYGRVIGVDISAQALQLCRNRGIHNVRKASIDALPFSDNTFDMVACFDVLGQKQVNERVALAEFHRVLKPEGVLLLRVAAYPWLFGHHDNVVQTKRRYTKKSLMRLMKKQSFSIMRVTHANALLFLGIVLKRMLLDRYFSKEHTSDVVPVPRWLNTVLSIPFYIECFLLRYVSLPFGLSIIVVAKK